LNLAFAFSIKSFERQTTKNVSIGCCQLGTSASATFFPYTIGDNELKRHRGLLESPTQKHNHLKDKIINHGHN
jgi:hypothetical protein